MRGPFSPRGIGSNTASAPNKLRSSSTIELDARLSLCEALAKSVESPFRHAGAFPLVGLGHSLRRLRLLTVAFLDLPSVQRGQHWVEPEADAPMTEHNAWNNAPVPPVHDRARGFAKCTRKLGLSQ